MKKRKLVDQASRLNIGSVIALDDTRIGKIKNYVIVGRSKGDKLVGCAIMNSNLNFKVFKDQAQMDQQYPLMKRSNPWLDHDSFIDCTNIWEFKECVAIEKSKHLGNVASSDIEEIRRILPLAKTISRHTITKFGLMPPDLDDVEPVRDT